MRSFVLVLAALALLPGAGSGALFPRQRVEADYRQALALWAAGDDERALAAVARLAAEAPDSRAAARLDRARRSVARGLGRRQGEALLAIARLEMRAYHDQVAGGTPERAAASRLLAAELAEEHALRGRAGSGGPAAALIAHLGSQLHLAAQEPAAAGLYQRALAIDPRQPVALLGLAALREKRGDYAAVVALLRPVDPVPGGREGRLRLALNLLRVGARQKGEGELLALAGESSDWVRSLAAQELARALAARGDLATARATLAAAAAVLPCDPSLPMQAALLAERSGADVPLDLAALAECAAVQLSPRARYARPPTGEAQALRQRLDELDPAWREALRQALRR